MYTGDMIPHKVLKANLPTGKVVGDHIYFVVNAAGDKTGEIWINDNSGELVCCAQDFTPQINILEGNTSTINGQLKGKALSYAFLNDIKTTSNHTFLGIGTDGFSNGSLWNLHVFGGEYGENTSTTQIATCSYSTDINEPQGTIKTRTYYALGIWGPWRKIATTDKIDISFPYNTGFETMGSGYVSKIVNNSLGQARVYGAVKKTDGTNFEIADTIVGLLPIGFLSKFNTANGNAFGCTIVGSPITGSSGKAAIYNNNIYVFVSASCPAIVFQIDYEIA